MSERIREFEHRFETVEQQNRDATKARCVHCGWSTGADWVSGRARSMIKEQACPCHCPERDEGIHFNECRGLESAYG